MFNIPYENLAQIRVTQIPLPYGKQRLEYEWIGESNMSIVGYFENRDVFLPRNAKVGTDFWLGHLNLVVVDHDYMSDSTLVALADGRAYQSLYARKAYYFLDNLKCRLILTLYVWGLAHIEQGERITWGAVGRKNKRRT